MILGNGGHAAVIREFYAAEEWIIAIGDNRVRKREAGRIGGPFGIAIHGSAIVSPSAIIHHGTVVMAGAVIQAGAIIGRHCIVNTGASVDHHCLLEDFVHIAPGARLCGNVKVGEGTLIGVGVAVAPKAVIPAWSLLKTRRLEIEPLPGN